MRVIAGKLGGRNFNSPHGHRTHPMSEKMRGGLFNALGDIGGLTVLDAFSGSGALGFEAISRGAKSALLIDSNKEAQFAIKSNTKQLGLARVIKLVNASAGSWLSTSMDTFDLVICDPPYDDLQLDLILKLAERVNANGLIVLSLPPDKQIIFPTNTFDHLVTKDYGDAKLEFHRRR